MNWLTDLIGAAWAFATGASQYNREEQEARAHEIEESDREFEDQLKDLDREGK